MAEDAQKPNTDCVYFLASPLTCKKGNECEFRHSEAARTNPRDCWFWLNGNCLNANCSFRHPPLDGILAATPVSGPLPTAVAAAASLVAASESAVVISAATQSTAGAPVLNKSRGQCFFFSKGFCARGDKCFFIHGPPVAQSIEDAAYQKPPKAPVAKGTDKGDNLVSEIKGNGSATFKQMPQELLPAFERRPVTETESHSIPLEVAVRAQSVLLKDAERLGISESSVTSVPSRCQSPIRDDKVRLLSFAGDRTIQIQNPDDTSRQNQFRENRLQHESGDECLRQAQSDDERLRQHLSRERGKHNVFETEEWWKESSPGFDVLVDNGLDPLMYTEDVEYLSHSDLALESRRSRSRGRTMHPDNSVRMEYDRSGTGYDNLGEYEDRSFEHHNQQLGSFGHVRRQQRLPYNAQTREAVLARETQGIVVERDVQHSSGDLRDHLVKRCRPDRPQHSAAENYKRRLRPDNINNVQLSQRHQYDHSKQNQVPSQQRVGLNHSRASKRADFGGRKRAYLDIGSDYKAVSRDRVPMRNSLIKRPVNGHSTLEVKDRENGRYAAESASIPDARFHVTSNSEKCQQKKDLPNFTGPKSLAQIKSEKIRAGAEAAFKAMDGLDRPKSCMHFGTHPGFAEENSQISLASRLNFGEKHKEDFPNEERQRSLGNFSNHKASKALDFEGSESLRLTLQKKVKPELYGDIKSENTRMELAFEGCASIPGKRANNMDMRTTDVSPFGISKDVEDGEVLPESNISVFSPEVVEGSENKQDDLTDQYLSNHRGYEMPLEEGLASRLRPGVRELKPKEVQRNQGEVDVRGKILSSEKIVVGSIESGDSASDEEYVFDDDEDDDFAKKLGGFFS